MKTQTDKIFLTLSIKVVPNSRKDRILRDTSKTLKVYVQSPRENGKANNELCALFKTTFKPIKFELKILSGEFQPKKILELVFGSMQEYHGFLEKLAGLDNLISTESSHG